ncbi:MAG: hypothetical protein IJI05_02025 [Erysipelotrichaceae bacterium]|nr:hypothetical protein [Erysipelotrichaceae bacterium]
MLERLFGLFGLWLVDYLFGALFKVLYVYRIPNPIRYSLAAVIVISYFLIEGLLVHEAVRCHHQGNTYLMWLCIIGAVLFAILIVAGFFYQRKHFTG